MRKIFIFIFFSITALLSTSGAQNLPVLTPHQKVSQALKIIDAFYIDTVDDEKLAEEAIVAMLKTLDPHSLYSDPRETEELTTPLDGNFSGIGIQFQMLNDTLYVIQPTAGGPSEKVGMLAGDRIIRADSTQISGAKLSNADIMKVLRGPKGTIVNVEVLRKGVAEPIEFVIERDDIPVNSVDAAYMADNQTGYIRLTRFSATSQEEMLEALAKLKAQGMKRLILDLEDNGGGYLGAAVDIAGNFLNKGDLVTYTESPRSGQITPFVLPSSGRYSKLPLVVMVNQYSASAAEILSGALQDHDRAAIVGRRTFGKGLVQRPFPFPDGSMIRLTISRYHTPSGRSIQKPYNAGQSDEYRMDIMHRLESGELTGADMVELPDSLKFSTLKRHRPVYGGGGIMPDRFVAIDTTLFTPYYRDLVAKSIINKTALHVADTQADQLKSLYPTEQSFIDNYEVNQELIKYVVDEGEKTGVEPNDEQLNQSLPMLKTILKGLIGRDLFEMNTYYRIVQPELNPVYRAALESFDILSAQK